MLKKILFFLKYNNFVILILAIIFVVGTGAFAASEPGQEFIGQKETEIKGVDNTLLLEADLEKLDMDYKIEKIEEDEDYFYITYTCLELLKKDSAWQYQLNEKNRKISKNIKVDLGVFLAEELKEEYYEKIKELKLAKAKAQTEGESIRQEVTTYGGLIGKTLAITASVFDGYEPVKINPLPSPTIPPTVLAENISTENNTDSQGISPADNLTSVINNYMEENDPDKDGYVGVLDNCPNDSNITQVDTDMDGIGDDCEVIEEQISLIEEQVVPVSDEPVASDQEEIIQTEQEKPVAEDYETVEVVEIK